jgi:hypothetical protein
VVAPGWLDSTAKVVELSWSVGVVTVVTLLRWLGVRCKRMEGSRVGVSWKGIMAARAAIVGCS